MSTRSFGLFPLAALALIAVPLALSGCATLSKGDCESGDWYGIGVRDGAAGRGEERYVENAKACAKHGITPDRERWLDGRMRGLERFCTVQNGLSVGESNGAYNGVCPQFSEGEFLRGYEVGRELSRVRGRLDHVNHEVHELHERLDEKRRHDCEDRREKAQKEGKEEKCELPPRLSSTDRASIIYELVRYEAERLDLERQRDDMERRASEL